jgi:hypothetical protein
MVSLARTSGKEGVDRRPLFFFDRFPNGMDYYT